MQVVLNSNQFHEVVSSPTCKKITFFAKLEVALLFFLHDSPMLTGFVYVGVNSTLNSEVPSSSTLFL